MMTMQSDVTVPQGLLTADDLSDLRALTEITGPFASVYIQIEPAEADALDRFDIRWRAARDRLLADGAPPVVVDAVGAAVADKGRAQFGTVAVFAHEGGDPFVELLPPDQIINHTSWAALPVLAPVLVSRQHQVPHVVVLVDRAGADLIAAVGDKELGHDEVVGESYPIERNAPGGWSQPRYQRRAITSWEENAAQVAAEVDDLARRVEARFVAVAGDVRMVAELRDALAPETAELVREMAGTRHRDGSADAQAEEVTRLVDTAAAEVTVQVMRQIRDELGRHGNAVQGAGEVLAALAAGQVAALATNANLEDERVAWFGPEPMQVGMDRVTLEDMGVGEPREGRLLDVATRAALGSGASIHVVPNATGDMAALLRW